jgi:hypothetical protein
MVFFTPFLNHLRRWLFRGREPALAPADLEDMDVSVQGPLTLLDEEKFEIEDGQLVATSGTISDNRIVSTSGKTLNGSVSHRLLLT